MLSTNKNTPSCKQIRIYITKCNLTTSNHRLEAKAAAGELRDILSGKMSSTQSITDQHHEHQSIQTQEKHRIASLIKTSWTPIYPNTHKKTEQHHWSTTSWTPIYPNTAKTQNNITDQKQCKHQSTDMQEKTQNNITDQLHHEHQFIQMQEKQGIASLIDCIMNTNLSWSTTSWTPIYSNAGKTGNSIVDWLHHEHQSFLINYIMNTNLSKCRKNKE